MKILVINQPLNNRGDESAHKGLIRKLLKEFPLDQVEVFFVAENADSIKQFAVDDKRVVYKSYLSKSNSEGFFYKYLYEKLVVLTLFFRYLNGCLFLGLHYLWWLNPLIWPVIKIIRNADIVLCAPGGICMGGFQSWPHISYLYLAKLLKKHTYYYGRSIGPFPEDNAKQKRFKQISLELLDSFVFTSLRDVKSQKIAQLFSVKFEPTIDSAFLDTPIKQLPSEIIQMLPKKYIVFVPNALIWHYAYKNIPKESIIKMYMQMLDMLLQNYPDCKVVMLPQTFNYRDPLWNDINFFKEIKKQYLQKDKIVIVNDSYSSDIQQTIISEAALIVGARYHSIVFAINNKVAFIALCYEHKMLGLLEQLGALKSSIQINDLSSQDKIDQILLEFNNKLHNLVSYDKCLAYEAKKIAEDCFMKFKTKVTREAQ